jgi:hypothetical protein
MQGGMRDTAGKEPGTLLPPPPDLSQAGQCGDRPKGWRKFFAIVGVVGAFFIFFTIPGWMCLSTYRKWKRGEYVGRSGRTQPIGLIAWGVVVSAVVVIAIAASPFIERESDHLRQGYYDTGETGTAQDCVDQGGKIVDDVCYLP